MNTTRTSFITIAAIALLTIGASGTASADQKQGGDYPNEKCQRNEKNGTMTTGQCTSVCQGLDIKPTRDVNTGLRQCDAKAERLSNPFKGIRSPGELEKSDNAVTKAKGNGAKGKGHGAVKAFEIKDWSFDASNPSAPLQ